MNKELICRLQHEIGAYSLLRERNKQQLLSLESKKTEEATGAIAEIAKMDYFLEQNILANNRALLRLNGRLKK